MNKQSLDQLLLDIWNKKELQKIFSLFSEEVILHSPLGSFQSSHEMEVLVKKWQAAIPDIQVTHQQILQDGSTYAVHWQAKGTHLGLYDAIEPKGNAVSYSGCSIYRFEDDQVVEYWAFVDRSSLERQMKA